MSYEEENVNYFRDFTDALLFLKFPLFKLCSSGTVVGFGVNVIFSFILLRNYCFQCF